MIALVCSVLFLSGIAAAQSPEIESARRDFETTHSFDSSKMSYADQAKQAPRLSALWDRYDKSPDVYREALLGLLRQKNKPEILYCDGGMLLLIKSLRAEDTSLGLQAIAQCSLSEIEHTPYLYTLHALALRGVDILVPLFRILEKPKYVAYIAAHSMDLGQAQAFAYPLLVQQEQSYVPSLINRFATEKDLSAQKSILEALSLAATPEAFTFLERIARSGSYHEDVKKAVQGYTDMHARMRSLSAQDRQITSLKAGLRLKEDVTESRVREQRRSRMRSISDEALDEYYRYTQLLYWLVPVGEAVKQ